ncbi:hypothetical protein M885DRAFT_196885 [Pelagophyceae sp. CCMP2097]|nr:hypothetical protein M885DRAFT_196885 [Pelagophyceae sp. CCMP2097]
MMRGCVDFLTSKDPRAVKLRDAFVFKIVPMLNPDGVINGNYRSSLAGEDLNRRYAQPSATLQPTVFAVKQLLRATHEARGVLLYVDMHGHSRRKNIFFYGCAEPKMAPPSPIAPPGLASAGYVDEHEVLARVVPRIASNLNGHALLKAVSPPPAPPRSETHSKATPARGLARSGGFAGSFSPDAPRRRAKSGGAAPANGASGGALFSFRDASFGVQMSKKATGRVVAWRELGIANSFTLEASFCSPGPNDEQGLLNGAPQQADDQVPPSRGWRGGTF